MIHSLVSRRQLMVKTIGIAASMACRPIYANEQMKHSAELLISRLCQFLWRSQQDDGRWKSSTYAVLQSGQALTPFVLFALSESSPSFGRSSGARRALQWIRTQLRHGTLGVADPDVLEYPVFATAFALRCFHRMRTDIDQERIRDLRRYLIEQQFNEARGFHSEHLAFGGWGFGGEHPPGQTGHMDLSHVRWVLTALQETSIGTEGPRSYEVDAQRFLRLVQKSSGEDRSQPLGYGTVGNSPLFDGGFYFSPIVLAANKGRVQHNGNASFFRSYATATCDGVLALLASGVDPRDARVVSAMHWLESNPSWNYPAGIPREYPEPWGDAVFFYHQAARAETYARLKFHGDWAELLIDRLFEKQRADGSIINERSALMKENDPILCSSLALIAAAHALRSLQ